MLDSKILLESRRCNCSGQTKRDGARYKNYHRIERKGQRQVNDPGHDQQWHHCPFGAVIDEATFSARAKFS